MKIDFETIIPKFDKILERGLCEGVGNPDGQMCIEAAITQAMGLPFSDEPSCVEPAVRAFKIALNDSHRWYSAESRAKGLRDIGIAQIGSAGVVDGVEFTKRLAEKTIQILIPSLFREVFKDNFKCLEAADRCEREGTGDAANAAYSAAAYAAAAETSAASYSAAASASYSAANAAANAAAAYAANAKGEKYLILSANLALEVLRELKSPGCEWID